jgi:hypothetical protein
MAVLAYRLANGAADRFGRWGAAWRAAVWCCGLALGAAILLGNPSCEVGDPMFGACEAHAENGFAPTDDQRGATFLFFALVLGAPAFAGALTGYSRRSLVESAD